MAGAQEQEVEGAEDMQLRAMRGLVQVYAGVVNDGTTATTSLEAYRMLQHYGHYSSARHPRPRRPPSSQPAQPVSPRPLLFVSHTFPRAFFTVPSGSTSNF